jgi:hypothetical protein
MLMTPNLCHLRRLGQCFIFLFRVKPQPDPENPVYALTRNRGLPHRIPNP